MLASELRIGNLLEDDIGNIIVIDEDSLPYIVTKWIKCHHPIPLTEEWLLKFGFYLVEVFDTKIYFIKSLKQIEIRVYEDGGIDFGTENEWLTELKYVHQLQNLYFALTGKELEYEKRD